MRLDSIDHIIADISDLTGGFVWTIGKGLLGDIGDMNFNNIKNKSRSGGDLNMVYSLLQFIADNAGIISKIAYGLGTSDGISLGLIGNFLDLGLRCSVIGNAALVKSEVKWDIIDDADLSPEQVADLALDLVDNDLLAGMEPIDLSIVGELRLDSVDHIAADIDDLTSGFVWGIGKGLLGDLGDMNFDAIAGKQRSGGDLNFVYSLLQFLADNAGIVSKIAYGLGTDDGISLGLVGSFLDLTSFYGNYNQQLM